jgi:hypothetical protein
MTSANEVILGGAAKAFAKRIGIAEEDVKAARVGPVSDLGGREWLILLGTLPDGRSVRLTCRFDEPFYISSFRPI